MRRLMSSSVESIVSSGASSSSSSSIDRGALAQALRLDALPDRVAVRALELGGQLGVEPLRLAGLAAQILLRLAELADLLVGELERLEQDVLGHLVGAGLDHRQAVLRADDDQVERRLLEVLLVRRVDDELAVDRGRSRTAPTGPKNGSGEIISAAEAPLMQRMSCGVTRSAERTVQITCTSLRKPFGHSGRIGRSIIRAVRVARSVARPFALEEAARDLPGGVRALLDVDREREEVRSFARLRAADGGREDHRLARAHDDRAVRLLGELAGLERDLLAADLDGNRGSCPMTVLIPCPPLCLVESGGLDQPRRAAGLVQASTLPDC